MNNEELEQKILQRVQEKISIFQFNEEEKKLKKSRKKIVNIVAIAVMAISLSVGTSYATSIIYEKVFKKPEKIENYIESLKVTEEDINKIISKEEAINKAKQEITKYGFEIQDNQIESVEINKNPNYDQIFYILKTKNELTVFIDGYTGKITNIYDDSIKEIEQFTSTEEEIIKVAKDKIKEYGFSDEYKVAYVSNNNEDDSSKAYLWYICFAKQYDGLFNYTESINMTIVPEINAVKALTIIEEPFDNNPIILTEEEAISIAQEKDYTINSKQYEPMDIKANLEIKRMNPNVYLVENGVTNINEVAELEDGTKYYYNTYKLNRKSKKSLCS